MLVSSLASTVVAARALARLSACESSSICPSRSKMRARVRVGVTRRCSTGPIRSGLIENTSESSSRATRAEASPAPRSSSLSGSTSSESVSTAAEAEIAAAMMSACVVRLCVRASMMSARKWLSHRKPTTRTIRPPRLSDTMRRVSDDETFDKSARRRRRRRNNQRDLRQRVEDRGFDRANSTFISITATSVLTPRGIDNRRRRAFRSSRNRVRPP